MMRHITKFLLLLTILMTCKFSAKSQDYLPFVNDNYAGISSVHFQPASIADSRMKFDLTLAGVSFNLHNNYIYLYSDSIPNLRRSQNLSFNSLAGLRYNGLDKFVYQDTRFDIMNFMITINPRIAIGFTAGVREVFNIDNVPEPFLQLIEDFKNNGYLPTGVMLHEDDMRINMSAWAEYGISLAGVVYKTDRHVIKAGMNAKLLQGLSSAYINIKDADFQLYGNDSVRIYNTEVNYGIADGVGRILDGEDFNPQNLASRFGASFDFGIVWEWRPGYENHLYDMDGKTNLERRNENKYKLKVGLSVRDLGAVKFKKYKYSQDFILNGYFNGHMVEDFESLEDVSNFINNSNYITPIEGEEFYSMALPTTISMQVDYNIYKDFYVNFTPNLALRQGHNKYTKVHTYSNVSLTPRYETALFGVSLPLQYSDVTGFAAGAGLRLGPIWVGSNNIFSNLFGKKIDNSNVQVLFKVPIPYTKVKDRDNDLVSNKKDLCIDEPGVWENNGCPYDDDDNDGVPNIVDNCPSLYGKIELDGCPDADNDGITDSDDVCPDTPGLALYNGCPDSDNDSIPDNLDVCPTLTGLAIFGGCPDTDNDSIPDNLDKCPSIAGLEKFEGCPDTDGDGLQDSEDNCPNVAGSIEMNGCPDIDSDGDGLKDADDKCPNMAGPAEFNGCPDSDEDGLPDHEDQCPNIAGPIEFEGCPDTDSDSIPDHIDGCPMIKGLAVFNGCPDSDNDSIPDHIDECPMIKGLAAFNGCPDTDGDGVTDKDDECPEEPGAKDNKGCPIYVPVEFATNIGFESGKATLTKESYPYLDQLVDLMNEDERCWVKLDGHTDNTGSDKINQKLSQDRVDAIKNYLIEKGISADRIIAKGHGSTQPIADNKTAEGRAKNRRVEINIAH